VTSQSGKLAAKFVEDLVDEVESNFPSHDSQKEVYQLLKDTVDERMDRLHTHLGTQGKFGPSHGAGIHYHNEDEGL